VLLWELSFVWKITDMGFCHLLRLTVFSNWYLHIPHQWSITKMCYLVNVHLLKCRLHKLEVADIFMLQMCVKLHLFQQYWSFNLSHNMIIFKWNHKIIQFSHHVSTVTNKQIINTQPYTLIWSKAKIARSTHDCPSICMIDREQTIIKS